MIRFYGVGSGPDWPERTPRRILLALLRQMPVLTAREALEQMAVNGLPYIDEYDRASIVASYQAEAYPDPPVRKRRPVLEHNPGKAAEMARAFGFVVVERRKDEEGRSSADGRGMGVVG